MFRIIRFYVPMGISSLLAALTHVIINGVLARSEQPDVVISSYAVAVSLSFLLDLPMNAIRQASSKFSRDRVSFRSVRRLALCVAASLVCISVLIGWTPLGEAVFRYLFGVNERQLGPTVQVYQVLAFLYAFTSMRSLFQWVIINRLRTGWMTIGMATRVAVMFAMSWYFIHVGWTNDGRIGALIFMTGIAIECLVAVGEGRSLARGLPQDNADETVRGMRTLLPFYLPLLYSSAATAILQPSLQASLNMTSHPTVAVASFAVALQLSNMLAWFCASVHQIVIQFYADERRRVLAVIAFLSVFSPAVLLTFSTEAGGGWLLEGVLGVHGELLHEVRRMLPYLALQSCLFPWIDFGLGLSILRGVTKAPMLARIGAVVMSLALLALGVAFVPQLNGSLAAIVNAVAAPVELLLLLKLLRKLEVGGTPLGWNSKQRTDAR